MKLILSIVLFTSTGLIVALPPDLRIVGGSDASPGEFPYQVSLQEDYVTYPKSFCSGTIYNEKFVLTACHCILTYDPDNPQRIAAFAGNVDISSANGDEQTRRIIRIIHHPEFSSFTMENDIALLELDEPFVFNKFVQPLPIPDKLQTFSGECVVTGWGKRVGGYYVGNTILQKVAVPIVSDDECSQDYSNLDYPLPLPSMICAGAKNQASCEKDSGGPLACQGFLAGIVSWGHGCGEYKYPEVHTEVSFFSDWIIENAIPLK